MTQELKLLADINNKLMSYEKNNSAIISLLKDIKAILSKIADNDKKESEQKLKESRIRTRQIIQQLNESKNKKEII